MKACMHTEWLLFSKEGAVHVSAAMNEPEHWELTASLADCRCRLIYRRHVNKHKMMILGIMIIFDLSQADSEYLMKNDAVIMTNY